MCSTEKFGTISKVKKKILFDSVMLLLGVYLAKRIKRTYIHWVSYMEDNHGITHKSKTLKLV